MLQAIHLSPEGGSAFAERGRCTAFSVPPPGSGAFRTGVQCCEPANCEPLDPGKRRSYAAGWNPARPPDPPGAGLPEVHNPPAPPGTTLDPPCGLAIPGSWPAGCALLAGRTPVMEPRTATPRPAATTLLEPRPFFRRTSPSDAGRRCDALRFSRSLVMIPPCRLPTVPHVRGTSAQISPPKRLSTCTAAPSRSRRRAPPATAVWIGTHAGKCRILLLCDPQPDGQARRETP